MADSTCVISVIKGSPSFANRAASFILQTHQWFVGTQPLAAKALDCSIGLDFASKSSLLPVFAATHYAIWL